MNYYVLVFLSPSKPIGIETYKFYLYPHLSHHYCETLCTGLRARHHSPRMAQVELHYWQNEQVVLSLQCGRWNRLVNQFPTSTVNINYSPVVLSEGESYLEINERT